MEFISPEIEKYAENHTSPENELLKKISRETNMQVLMPRMLSGHMQGRILSFLSKLVNPIVILEIGTYTGYSALCMAEGLKPGGKLITIDNNKELEKRVRGYFAESRFDKNIEFLIGNAMDIVPGIKDSIDLVFIDADKENYSNYFDLVIDKVPSGGLIIADNVLWSGKVLSDPSKMDIDTRALHEFNQKVKMDSRVEELLLPVRDGLMLLLKK